MKQKITLLVILCLFCINGQAQTLFWSDTFEDTGAPLTGTRTPSITEFSCGGPPATAYFFRTATSGVATQNGTYSGFQGFKVWAVEDIDKALGCANNSISANQQVTWNNINIAGKSGLSFKGLFAANNVGSWQGINFGTTAQDFLAVEYQIDGGAWTKAIAFYSNVPISSAASSNTLDLDTNGDMVGDGAGLNYVFTEYTANIPGTGNTLNLRFNCFANAASAQELSIDNFRLFEAACTAPTITTNPPNRTICAANNTTFSVAATGATSYQWQVNTGSGFTDLTNGGVYSGVTSTTLTITGATAGMSGYLYRAVAINGVATCFTNSNSGTLTVSNITSTGSSTSVSCNGGSNGAATVSVSGGIAPYTYSWSPSGGTGATASGLSPGSYTVTITDANSCTATRNFTITQPTAISTATAAQTNVSCNGGSNGSASVTPSGGTPGYTYSWSPSGGTAATATGLSAGTYTVTVTDANSCTATRNFTITQPTSISTATASQTNVSCNGGSNGSASVTPSGGTPGYTYSWSPSGGTAATATGLSAGTYTVTVTDANSCTATRNFTITQPTSISTATAAQTNVSCNGGSNGSASVTPSGGAGGYTYSWSPSGGTAATATGLSAGTYTV
ncbi:SprB repeat-containing protein, partial [Flavobacterium sp. F-408]|nr:SprB repeat-containing protein [Flavobacterium bernardetii]